VTGAVRGMVGLGGALGLLRYVAVAAAWAVTGAGVSAMALPEAAASRVASAPAVPSVVTGPTPAAVPTPEELLGLAVHSSHEIGYRGTQTVLVWNTSTNGGSEAAVLHVVVGGPGLMRMEVSDTAHHPGWVLVQRGDERSMYGLGSGLLSQAPAEFLVAEDLDEHVQRMLEKYTPVLDGPVQMLGRSAWRVSILRKADKRLVERWTIDAATGVILERDGFERHGRLERMVSFSDLEVPYDAPKSDFSIPPVPSHGSGGPSGPAAGDRPAKAIREQVVATMRPDATGFRPPEALPAGYRVASQTRFDAVGTQVVHLTYSDGLEPLSLFRQPGALQRGTLPEGATPTKLRKVQGYAWESFPRGLAWQDGQASFVLVGAASTDELIRIANALPQSGLRRSIPQRIGHFFKWLRRSLGSIF
jgi:hypothetical protein